MRRSLVPFVLIAIFWAPSDRGPSSRAAEAAEAKPLKKLSKIYVSVHAQGFLDLPPGDPKRKIPGWNQYPGRCELAYARALELQKLYEQLILDAKEDEGMFCMTSPFKGTQELEKFARKHFGPRMVSIESEKYVERYPTAFSADFYASLEADRQAALKNRGPGWSPTNLEWIVWKRSKAMAVYFKNALAKQGYTFDPETAQFVAFGSDWSYCSATYSIHLARALGLSNPIQRRADLCDHSCGRMLLKATVVYQGSLPGDSGIQLYIFKTANESPTWGRYVAQFYEGMHGIMDRPRVVSVDFPKDTVWDVNLFGWALSRAMGVDNRDTELHGPTPAVMSVGCGGHTPHYASLVLTHPYLPGLSLEDFRKCLLAGKVSEKK